MTENLYNEAPLSMPDGTPVSLRPATPGDLDAVRSLLAAARLPVEDTFDAAYLAGGYVVGLADGGDLVAVAGVEVYGGDGLLRSVAVRNDCRGSAIGRAVTHDRIAWARGRGLGALYLLTETAPGFFERLDFRRIERDDFPAAVRASSEFTHVCPDTAVAMVLELS